MKLLNFSHVQDSRFSQNFLKMQTNLCLHLNCQPTWIAYHHDHHQRQNAMSEPEFGGVWGMPGILIFEIFSLMQISQQCFIHCKRKSGLLFSSIDKWKQEAQCKIKWRSCPNEAMSGRKSLRCGSKEGGDGSQSVTPPHYQPSPPHPPETLIRQAPEINNTIYCTFTDNMVQIYERDLGGCKKRWIL